MTKDRLRIAYLCDYSPLNPNLYSGGNARIYGALQKHVGDVTILDEGWGLAEPVRRLILAMPDAINLRARWRVHLMLRHIIARSVRKQLEAGAFDVVFCAYSLQSLAGVHIPDGAVSVYCSDATQTTYKRSEVGQSFQSYLSVSRVLDPWFAAREAEVLDKTDVLLWPTEWLRAGAEEHLNVPPGKAQVVPWGANLDTPPDRGSTAPMTAGGPVRLLFVGRDWWAKGGPMAREVTQALNARGIEARLSVIGTHPPEEQRASCMDIIGPLDKSKAEEMAQFEAAFRAAHFLINPSFESYGFAYCEAAAYSLPAISLKVGGVPVRDGINGHAFEQGVTASEIAERIAAYAADPNAHTALRASSRTEFEERLNWDAWGQQVSALLKRNTATR